MAETQYTGGRAPALRVAGGPLAPSTDSYAFSAETPIKSLRSGCGCVEVPIRNIYHKGIKTSALRAWNVRRVSNALVRTAYDVCFT